jgi:hypothetical protein
MEPLLKERNFQIQKRIPKHSGNPDHPVCAAAVASHLFLDGAATPPMSGGELPASTFIARLNIPLQASLQFAASHPFASINIRNLHDRHDLLPIPSIGSII